MSDIHRPVLAEEVIRHLVLRPEGIYIDGTVGAGGHAEAILNKLEKKGRLLGIDRDEEILNAARRRLAVFGERCLFLHGSYEDLDPAGDLLGTRQVDGILLDLGISSLQVDRGERGFSFAKEARLDMRMDPSDRTTAAEILRRSTEGELERILKEFGEERFARRIAKVLVAARRREAIETTTQLAGLVAGAVPRRAWPRRIHPATRTFQALRIAVNRELERLDAFLEKAPDFLASGGRVVVIAYHSLEDRIVKQSFLQWERRGVLRRLNRKPICPSEVEIRENPRGRSAKMRAAEKL